MIEIKNCTVTYAAEPNHRVLKDISLTIEDGEFVLFTGESGCGKTTILRLMNGLIPYFYDANVEGEIYIYMVSTQSNLLFTIWQRRVAQFFKIQDLSFIPVR